jgi:two-component system heavy metal sensor histidine kinase CusS
VRSRLSIFATLVLWFTLSGLVVLGGMSYFLLRTFEQSQFREHRDLLWSRVADVANNLQHEEDDVPNAEDFAAMRQAIARENAVRPRMQMGVAVTENGRTLLESGPVPAGAQFPAPSNDLSHLPVVRYAASEEHDFLLSSATVNRHGHKFVLYVWLDETVTREAFDDFRTNTLVGLFAAASLLAVAGALVARHAMQPLARITDATQAVDVTRLDVHLDDSRWPAELRTLASEFTRMQIRLRDSFDRLTQFSDDIAHELRTPVTNLMGVAEATLLARSRPEQEYRETLASILEESDRLRRTIEELLFLARAEHPRRDLDRVPLDAALEASAVVDFFIALAEDRHIVLSAEGQGRLNANRDLFRRALSNLVQNALQHAPAGGRVRIVVSESAAAVDIAVRDTGAGIDSAHLPRIFDRFYRVDAARRSEGTGLGLAIVRSIVELHGGTVDVQSEPGRTVFTMHFPKMTKL